MLFSYIKVAWRHLKKNRTYALLNIAGLAIGMASAILIMLWIQNELSYDQFHEKKDRLYQAWNRTIFDNKLHCWSTTPSILGPTLAKDYPEIEATTRVNWNQDLLFSIRDKRLKITGTMVDPSFLTMFDFPLVKGNAKIALNGAYDIVLTEKLARKLFGEENPMGQVIKLLNQDNVTVTGIMKDLPNNTRFNFEFLLSWEYINKKGWANDYWGNNSTNTYVLLKPNTALAAVTAKIKNITKEHTQHKENTEVFLHPANRWWLYSEFENGVNTGGRIELVRLFVIIAAFILLIACINFMNLSTARSEKRAKEVGIRKVAGATKRSLVLQFLGESVLLAFLSGLIAIVLVQLSLPAFNQLTDKQLYMQYGNGIFWLAALAFVLFTGLLAGSYPAFFLSSFTPIKVLKGAFKAVHAVITPRKVLVVLQFAFSITLIICTIIVQQQIRYARERESGYEKDHLIYHNLTGDLSKNYLMVRHELLNSGVVASVTKTSSPLTQSWSDSWGFNWQGKDPNAKIDFERFMADENLVATAGLRLVQGRDMNLKEYPTDSSAVLLNESAVAVMGFKHPLGQIIKDDDREFHVIGVIKDFILESPYNAIQPMIIEGAKGWFSTMHIKLNGQVTSKKTAILEKIFKKYNPEYPFDYRFVNEEYEEKFNDTKRIATLARLFAALTIVISCLGLFGLAAYMAENRVKEIGVRKVLGASVIQITTLLSKNFLQLVCIALLISVPIAWFAMFKWLQDFPYHINIHWWVFVLAGLLSIFIALATVSYESIKAALANPVKSLRTE